MQFDCPLKQSSDSVGFCQNRFKNLFTNLLTLLALAKKNGILVVKMPFFCYSNSDQPTLDLAPPEDGNRHRLYV